MKAVNMPPSEANPATAQGPAIDGPQATHLLTTFAQFLTICIHNILFYRGLYPATTFLTSRAYNLPVHQSRHPSVCGWIQDAVDAARVQIAQGSVERLALVIYDAAGCVMERWMFDLSLFPEWNELAPEGEGDPLAEGGDPLAEGGDPLAEGGDPSAGGADPSLGEDNKNKGKEKNLLSPEGGEHSSSSGGGRDTDDENDGRDEDDHDEDDHDEDDHDEDDVDDDKDNGSPPPASESGGDEPRDGQRSNLSDINWTDVDEQLRAAVRRLAYIGEKMSPLPQGCTFTVAVELRDEAEAPIGVCTISNGSPSMFRYVSD
ncbi:DNA-binding protein [Xylariaceae sp. FL0594]|nr:DNA-binding protein [Xylariaceae sp. FL0594]